MDLFSAAERLSAIDRKDIRFMPDRCLHSMDKFIECEACSKVCPLDAIAPGKPPRFTEESCQNCLACLPACPTGAYSAEDAIPALIKSAARIESGTVEIGCQAHPDLHLGPDDSTIAVRIRGCLAGLGKGGYMMLVAAGKEKISVRLDACSDCPWGNLQPIILDQLAETKKLLGLWNLGSRVQLVSKDDQYKKQARPVWEADNPPISRRDLFKFANQRSQLLAARAANTKDKNGAARRPSANRLRMIAAVEHMPESRNDSQSLSGFAFISVSKDCNACGACARVCPTGAIEYRQLELKFFQLNFQPAHCIGCGICQQLCVPEAITIDHQPPASSLFTQSKPVLLYEGEITRCERCNTIIAKKPEATLCLFCEHRMQNPFGGPLPEKLQRLIIDQAEHQSGTKS